MWTRRGCGSSPSAGSSSSRSLVVRPPLTEAHEPTPGLPTGCHRSGARLPRRRRAPRRPVRPSPSPLSPLPPRPATRADSSPTHAPVPRAPHSATSLATLAATSDPAEHLLLTSLVHQLFTDGVFAQLAGHVDRAAALADVWIDAVWQLDQELHTRIDLALPRAPPADAQDGMQLDDPAGAPSSMAAAAAAAAAERTKLVAAEVLSARTRLAHLCKALAVRPSLSLSLSLFPVRCPTKALTHPRDPGLGPHPAGGPRRAARLCPDRPRRPRARRQLLPAHRGPTAHRPLVRLLPPLAPASSPRPR